ncbi:hypothetical protein FRB94_002105 [Tulasnella sp. JGI-2019a]|nr:hypothetical protein FRB94_002105 [Tulasnella sp. JGI-2019a]KAG9023872.1 hypothetical protein FRB95_012381 [Tulasnella sp. JGI-2019a]
MGSGVTHRHPLLPPVLTLIISATIDLGSVTYYPTLRLVLALSLGPGAYLYLLIPHSKSSSFPPRVPLEDLRLSLPMSSF